MSEQQPELAPEAPAPVDPDEATGVGVYNETLERFVGGVFRGSSADKDARAFIKDQSDTGHKYVTRKV